VHPLAVAPSSHHTGLAKVGQVTRHLGLGELQYFREVAHTNLAVGHQMQNSEARAVGESAEQEIQGDFAGSFSRGG